MARARGTWGVFDPTSTEPYRVSRSKIDLFSECPRCAYLDMRYGVKRPSMPAFTLNNAVDELFKREFDTYRAKGEPHPLMKTYGIDAVPYQHEKLDEWRDALRRGIAYHHKPTNITLRGGIDDVWATPSGELIIVDYKATSKKEGPKSESDLYDSYKRQMEVYQWLFRKNDFLVSPTGYFVYANGNSNAKAFGDRLEFDVVLIPYSGNDDWVEPTLIRLKETLMNADMPAVGTAFGGGPCEYCTYREAAGKISMAHYHASKKETHE
ncbi:MAG: hypothetical protein B7X04_01120 [Parcubacteria group bacterium 21-54-25]|nr:MAG: hypothetical protein B7X04_01120 [Parcubacteria group bacterium 21-54-25]HQU07834.1 PD-(D/E)XK nuclease family protein [Candidatus Paceibacterota bacterium]